jgi:calcineurin-like phosphoesterase family protein
MRQTRRLLLLPLVASALLVPGMAKGADAGCPDVAAPRVVAVGDVHGAFDGFLSVLAFTGIVDDKGHWAGGQAHLVQTGDVLDRGPQAPQVLDLLMRLEGEARKAGGEVHALLGNHEVMNMLGDLRYVNAEEYKLFVTPESESLRQRFLESALERAQKNAKAGGEAFDAAAFRAKLLEQAPPGFVERTQAFSAEGKYGKWLRQHSVMVKINGVVFMHGGLTPEVAALGCDAVNRTVRREITDDIDKTLKEPLATLAASESGPLWYRGLAKEDETTFLPTVERVLQLVGARAIVLGHSVTGTGRITPRFGGRVVGIDVGLSGAYGGHLGALEVKADGSMAAVYQDRREDIPKPAAAARLLPVPAPDRCLGCLVRASP